MSQSCTMGNCRSKNEDTVDNVDPDFESSSYQNSETTRIDKNFIKAQFCNHQLGNSSNGCHHGHSTSTSDTNENVISATKAEVSSLLEGIQDFQGTSEKDKNYMYLDEMLTRCILRLDNIECNNTQDRGNRKETIRGVNQAISILERKLEFNSDIKKLETNLSNNS